MSAAAGQRTPRPTRKRRAQQGDDDNKTNAASSSSSNNGGVPAFGGGNVVTATNSAATPSTGLPATMPPATGSSGAGAGGNAGNTLSSASASPLNPLNLFGAPSLHQQQTVIGQGTTTATTATAADQPPSHANGGGQYSTGLDANTMASLGDMLRNAVREETRSVTGDFARLTNKVQGMIQATRQESSHRDSKLIDKPSHRRYFVVAKIIQQILESNAYVDDNEKLADAISMTNALATLAMDMGGPNSIQVEEAEAKMLLVGRKLAIANEVAPYLEPIRATNTTNSRATDPRIRGGRQNRGACHLCGSGQHWARNCPQGSYGAATPQGQNQQQHGQQQQPLAWQGVPGFVPPQQGAAPGQHIQYVAQPTQGIITLAPAMPTSYTTRPPRTVVICTHCNKHGHTVESCWSLNPSLRPPRSSN